MEASNVSNSGNGDRLPIQRKVLEYHSYELDGTVISEWSIVRNIGGWKPYVGYHNILLVDGIAKAALGQTSVAVVQFRGRQRFNTPVQSGNTDSPSAHGAISQRSGLGLRNPQELFAVRTAKLDWHGTAREKISGNIPGCVDQIIA